MGDKRVGGVHVDVGCGLYRIVGNFRKFRGFVAILCEVWERGKSKQSTKFSLQKSFFSPIRESFLPRKFSVL